MRSETAVPDGGGPDATADLFELLSDETRVRIVRELYREREHDPDDPGLTFSTLGRRIGADDTGRFNYHLRRLRGTLVDKREDEYVLSPLGVALGTFVKEGAGSSRA